MEDTGRELDTDSLKTPPVKNVSQCSKELTIMLIGSVGRMRSFKISRKLIVCASIFFSIYIVFSFIIFYLYFNLYSHNMDQTKELQNLKSELSDKTRAIGQNKLYIKGLEAFYNETRKNMGKNENIETPLVKSPEIKKRESVRDEKKEKTDSTIVEKPSKPDTVEAVTEENQAAAPSIQNDTKFYMEVKDIRFRKTDSGLTFDFKLENTLPDEKTAEGYIHIIVMNKEKECPPEWNGSYNKLVEGFPVDYKHGQQFFIQRFRPYQRQYDMISDSKLPSFIRILVYDLTGQKILEKELSVTDESENAPS